MPTHQLPPGIHPASSHYTCTTPSLVRGNAPYEIKKHVLDTIFAPAFAKNILLKAVLTEINKESYFNGDGKEKEVWTVVFEMDVEEGLSLRLVRLVLGLISVIYVRYA